MEYLLCCWLLFALVGQLLQLVSCYQIDPDTSHDVATYVRKFDGKVLDLVMSDEFNVDGRSFAPGEDDVFEAVERPDDTNQALEFCK